MLKVGDRAPDFTLLDEEGKEVRLSDFRGKWVVLYFYPKDNTPGCTTEAKGFSASVDEFEKVGAVILGVSPDSPESHRRFKERRSLKIKLLSDPDLKVIKTYGAWGKKRSFGKEREGIIRSTFLIDPEGVVRYVWPKVKPSGHAEEVLKTLKELGL
ncbi:MAG: thioredoxin-dependent thiol peroxidase [Thermotogae bacterium]|nr:thioredoxin-dependent thiol peroxidase [Thermotogota bacterium]